MQEFLDSKYYDFIPFGIRKQKQVPKEVKKENAAPSEDDDDDEVIPGYFKDGNTYKKLNALGNSWRCSLCNRINPHIANVCMGKIEARNGETFPCSQPKNGANVYNHEEFDYPHHSEVSLSPYHHRPLRRHNLH